MSDIYVNGVYIDFDYTPGDTIDFATSGDNITAYYQAASIRLGNQAYNRTASVGTCELTVLNSSRAFSPAVFTGAYYGKLLPNKPVKVTATDGTTTWTLFLGWTKVFRPQSNKYGDRKATISCVDWMGIIQQSNIDIPLRQNVISSQLILDVLNYALKAPVATARLDFSGNVSDGDTVTPNGTAYRFKTTPAQANDVQIGSSIYTGRYDTIKALVAAINGWDNPSYYYTNTTRPSLVRARASASYYQTVADDGPIRWYPMAEASGVIAYDHGSNASNATYVGSPTLGTTGLITNDSATAATFDATARYLTVPTLEIANGSFTVELWFKPAATPSSNQDLFSVFTAFTTNAAFYARYNDSGNGIVSVHFYSGAQVDSGTLTAGTAYHFVITYDYSTSTLRLYVNGALVDTATSAGPFTGTSPTIQIAAFTNAGATYVKGVMQHPAMWLRILSADEIAEHYAAKTAVSPGVTIYSMLRGAVGNSYTLTESATNVTASGATLSGGSDTPNMTTDIETGLRTFPYAGDDWSGATTNAMTALEQVVESERGHLFVQRDGTLNFKNFVYDFTGYSATATLETFGASAPTLDLDSELTDDDIINSVAVQFRPRSTTSTGVVAKITSPVKVQGRWGTQSSDPNQDKAFNPTGRPVGDPGQTVITLPYTDPDTGQRIGAKDLTLPLVATTDWTANEARDGSMVDYTTYSPQQLLFSVAEKASACEISIKNIALGVLYVLTLQVRGTKITRYDTQTALKEYATSIETYGRRQKSIALPLESDENLATAVAEYELSRFGASLWRIKTVDWRNIASDPTGDRVLSAELGDVITITEYQSLEDSTQVKLRIVGIRYSLGLFGDYNVAFDVEVVDDKNYGLYNGTFALYDGCFYTI